MASTSTSDGASEVLGFKPTALIDEVFNIVRFSARAPSRLAKPWCPLVLSAPEAVISPSPPVPKLLRRHPTKY